MLEHTGHPGGALVSDRERGRAARHLNCIRHLLSLIPYEDVIPPALELPPRPPADAHYVRPPRDAHIYVPDFYADH
ncbi:MAG: hypothetical protein U0521_15425 [Anaerolineae bacterium]